MDTSDGNTSDSPAAQDDPGGTDNYVQRWYVRDQDGHPAHGMVQLVSRPDGGLLVQLDHIEEDDGSTIGSTALFFRPGEEAEAFRTLAARSGRGHQMRQVAPWPDVLEGLIERLEYRDGWHFDLVDIDRGQGSQGLTFRAIGQYPDTYHPETLIRVAHYFIVPAAAYNEQSWRRWLFDRIRDIETHESAEFFRIGGERPYAPQHGPGNDPYIVFEHGSDEERRTLFTGEVKPPEPGPLETFVRVARPVLDALLSTEPRPVVLVGVTEAEDGTLDLTFRNADVGLENARQERDQFAKAMAEAEPNADDDCGGGGR